VGTRRTRRADLPPIREFADRGVIWLLESAEYFAGLVRLISEEVAEGLDLSHPQRINRSMVPDDLRKLEADLIYRAPLRDASDEALIYVLLEHQSDPDRSMGLRLYSYMGRLWESERRDQQDRNVPVAQWRLSPIVPIVFYTGRSSWKGDLGLESLLEAPGPFIRFVPRWETLFLSLAAVSAETLRSSTVGNVLRVMQEDDRPPERFSAALEESVRYLETLPETQEGEWQRAMWFLHLLIQHRREATEREPLYNMIVSSVSQRHVREVAEMGKTGAEELMERGMEKGLKEGLEKGRRDGSRSMLLALLRHRFGPLPDEIVAGVQALEEPALTEIAMRAIDSQTLTELNLSK
jgi:predicted transposase YdaD